MYQCKHYSIQELIPPSLYQQYEEWRLWLLFDRRILRIADLLRETYGPMTVNDWKWDGSYAQSGIRTPDSEYYSFTSQHRHGRALDMRPQDVAVETVRQDIMERKHDWMKDITGLELGVSWLHVDCRNGVELVTFKP